MAKTYTEAEVMELVEALEYIIKRDYIEVLGTVDSLRKWIREFRVVAKQALAKFKGGEHG